MYLFPSSQHFIHVLTENCTKYVASSRSYAIIFSVRFYQRYTSRSVVLPTIFVENETGLLFIRLSIMQILSTDPERACAFRVYVWTDNAQCDFFIIYLLVS